MFRHPDDGQRCRRRKKLPWSEVQMKKKAYASIWPPPQRIEVKAVPGKFDADSHKNRVDVISQPKAVSGGGQPDVTFPWLIFIILVLGLITSVGLCFFGDSLIGRSAG
eukprot:432195_1